MGRFVFWAIGVYILGGAVVLGLTGWMFATDAVDRGNLAFWIVLPLGWIFGYWGVVGPLGGLFAWRRFMDSMERIGKKVQLGQMPTDAEMNVLNEELTRLAASEWKLPMWLIRPWVPRFSAQLIRRQLAGSDAGSKSAD